MSFMVRDTSSQFQTGFVETEPVNEKIGKKSKKKRKESKVKKINKDTVPFSNISSNGFSMKHDQLNQCDYF
jgi:hypothetical protein